MQTFLPYADFTATAKTLDRQRLGKQRVEAFQILTTNMKRQTGTLTKGAWLNHPIVIMWNGYEYALCQYAIAICDEWIARGYKDTMRERFVSMINNFQNKQMPAWLGNEELHMSHRSKLIQKLPTHYADLFKETPTNLEYVWIK